MANHPNRKTPSATDKALGILVKDARSGYAEADSEGRNNIRRRYFLTIAEGLGQDDEIYMTPEQIADWYARTFWR